MREDIRNVAIVAHVDHGKTTLVDEMLKQSGIFRENQKVEERVMDSNALEKERGITILSKNTAIKYKDFKINIVDTPGHADFGGEVERVLKMVDGVILLVDAFEGPMPQTRFILQKVLELNLPVIVCINKIDRPDARPEQVLDEVYDLFISLDANDEQIEFPIIYTSSKNGTSTLEVGEEAKNLEPLFETIVQKISCPDVNIEEPLQMLISTIDYNEYVGRIGIGKVERGKIYTGQEVVIVNEHSKEDQKLLKITNIYEFEGLQRKKVESALAGSIVSVSGIENINIGDTICHPENPEPIYFVKISEPTLSMVFSVNNGPFAGREGEFVTSRQLRERLFKQVLTDVSLRVEETESTDSFKVFGRGELHLSVLIENMRREGYEFTVSKPQVILKDIGGKRYEPIEKVLIDVPQEFAGTIIEKLGSRKGEMINMSSNNLGYTRLEFAIPARGLIGYRSEFLTSTKGNGVINSIFDGYEEYKGEIPMRNFGSLVASETGKAVSYGLYNAQERGILFIGTDTDVYEGMIVGKNPKVQDIDVNVCKRKNLTNVRSSSADDKLSLSPPLVMSLEDCLEFIQDDEIVEVTPKNIRMRKKILNKTQRARSNRR